MLEDHKYNIKMYLRKQELKKGHSIYLKIYNITKFNRITQLFGFGIYHTTLEIQNFEYSFGSTEDNSSGIYMCPINEDSNGNHVNLREKIYLGNTLYNPKNIKDIILIHSENWAGNSYHPFYKNCNHFTNFLSELLLLEDVEYPDYVNRFTEYGMFLGCFYEPLKKIYGDFIYIPQSANAIQIDKSINGIEEPINIEVDLEIGKEKSDKYSVNEKIQFKKVDDYLVREGNNNYQIEFINSPLNSGCNEYGYLKKYKMDKKSESTEKELNSIIPKQDLVQILNMHNEFLRNSNDYVDDSLLLLGLFNSGSSNFDSKENIYLKNLSKYIKLADRFLYEENKSNKALSTFFYALKQIDEIFECRNIKQATNNECYSSPRIENDNSVLTDFSKFILENESCIIKIKLKILHSICYVHELLNMSNSIEKYLDMILYWFEKDYQALYKKWVFNRSDISILHKAAENCNIEHIRVLILNDHI